MPLLLLLALVGGGITAIAALLHLTGRSRQTVLDSESARRAWQRHSPGSDLGTDAQGVLINAARSTALLLPPAGPAAGTSPDDVPGLVWAFGADTAARSLAGASITPSQAGLRISFTDFAAPGVSIALTEQERDAWLDRLQSARLISASPPSPPPSPGARA